MLVIGLLIPWLGMRFAIPVKGMRVKRSGIPQSRWLRILNWLWCAVGYGGVGLFVAVEKQLAHPAVVVLIGAGVWCCVGLILLRPEIRRGRREYQVRAERAVEQWEQQEAERDGTI
jgi:hypothetical protein